MILHIKMLKIKYTQRKFVLILNILERKDILYFINGKTKMLFIIVKQRIITA